MNCNLCPKKALKFFSCIFFLHFLVIKALDPDTLEMQDPDSYPDSDSVNPGPQHCTILQCTYTVYLNICVCCIQYRRRQHTYDSHAFSGLNIDKNGWLLCGASVQIVLCPAHASTQLITPPSLSTCGWEAGGNLSTFSHSACSGSWRLFRSKFFLTVDRVHDKC